MKTRTIDLLPVSMSVLSMDNVAKGISISGKSYAREFGSHYFTMEFEFPPVYGSDPIFVNIEWARAGLNLLQVELIHPSCAREFKVGNFVSFTSHDKLYRIVELPQAFQPIPKMKAFGGVVLPHNSSAGVPTGMVLFPTPRSTTGTLYIPKFIKGRLDMEEVKTSYPQNSVISPKLRLQEFIQ